ncbi:receptor like protein 22-like [Carya illinoinensis]|uniref:receptor like protein 22-like n=1 Tax=Carya illinoinensis TaxID=32201 RepID=UPI001C726FB8|nr:receptor like protein 22-like [Carya illinoinensis]
MNAQNSEQILNNRLRVKTFIDVVRWLAFQGCAFTGHDETFDSKNRGNFLDMLKLLASYNDKVGKLVLENAHKSSKYNSPQIQKEILEVLAKKVRNKIREDVGDSQFCIIFYEARDESKREQMAIILRFVDVDGFIQERFFDLVHIKDTSVLTLKNEISAALSLHCLDIQNIRGQGYDGASNMRGEWNGLQALFLKDCPYAYYSKFLTPPLLGRNGKLQLLDLLSNNLTGTLPPYICFGNRLKILNTEENLLVGPIPNSLERCESLSEIRMGRNFLNGSMPRDLFSLPNLTNVMLQSNRLAGKFPIFLRNDSKLVILDISDNKIHGELPSWIWRLRDLQILNLSHNYLETLDVNLNSPKTSQSSFYILDLQSNQLKGQLSTLPLHFRDDYFYHAGLTRLSSIFFFSVLRNKFNRTIPTSMCNATLLEGVDLSNNLLIGMIPQCLIAMNLRVLNLGGNNLTGVIPDSFSEDLLSLQTLVLNGNQLEGELPKSLAKCNTQLEVLDIENNRIQDTYPLFEEHRHVASPYFAI